MEASRLDPKPPPPGSTASSADGYESFENTSNKKKRKIPLSSASSMHQSQLSAEMANMGISHPEGGHQDDTIPEQYTQGAAATVAGTGISGAGRGRYGRQNGKHERRPLASSSLNTVNGYHAHPAARMSDSPKDGSGKCTLTTASTGDQVLTDHSTFQTQVSRTPVVSSRKPSRVQQSKHPSHHIEAETRMSRCCNLPQAAQQRLPRPSSPSHANLRVLPRWLTNRLPPQRTHPLRPPAHPCHIMMRMATRCPVPEA